MYYIIVFGCEEIVLKKLYILFNSHLLLRYCSTSTSLYTDAIHNSHLWCACSLRSLFIWRPKVDHEQEEQKDERKIIICTGMEKKRKHKSKNDESDDDSDVDKFIPKGKNFKSRKPATKIRNTNHKMKR